MYDSTHASLDERGCKSLGPEGCLLQVEDRPPACGLFPLALNAGRLYLYTVCPASLFIALKTWIEIAKQAKQWLLTFPKAVCEHLALNLPLNVLSEKYLDMHLEVYRN